MVKRVWAFIMVAIVGAILFFSFQNFVGKDHQVKEGDKPTSGNDFNSIIEESLGAQNQLAQELEKAHPPERIGKEGLIKREATMKREIIEGTGEAVVAKGSEPFFKTVPPRQVDKNEDNKRISQELEGK